jgi:hypothetical protein
MPYGLLPTISQGAHRMLLPWQMTACQGMQLGLASTAARRLCPILSYLMQALPSSSLLPLCTTHLHARQVVGGALSSGSCQAALLRLPQLVAGAGQWGACGSRRGGSRQVRHLLQHQAYTKWCSSKQACAG